MTAEDLAPLGRLYRQRDALPEPTRAQVVAAYRGARLRLLGAVLIWVALTSSNLAAAVFWVLDPVRFMVGLGLGLWTGCCAGSAWGRLGALTVNSEGETS